MFGNVLSTLTYFRGVFHDLPTPVSIALVSLLATVFAVGFRRIIEFRKKASLPPGPTGLPLIGNALEWPTTGQSKIFSKWKKEYGDLTYVNVLGQSIIVTSSLEVACELLEKRSSIYSSRPTFYMLNDLVHMSWNFVFMEYGRAWRVHRRAFHEIFHSERINTFNELQLKHIKHMLKSLPTSTERIGVLLKRYTSALMLDSMYGIDIKLNTEQDPFMYLTTNGMAAVDAAITPGAFFVEAFPILRYVPKWFPGAKFQHTALKWKKLTTDLLFEPFKKARSGFNENAYDNTNSFMYSWLERLQQGRKFAALHMGGQTEEVIRNVAAAALLAGTETTAEVLHKFVLAMLLHPDKQAKAQQELDSVIGRNRLPTPAEAPDLPYLSALIKEVLRWEVLSPIGFAHKAIRDDNYHGYDIAKGTLIIVNVRDIMYNESLFGSETDKFIPERFLEPGRADTGFAFGFGRRICPGRHLAYQSIYLLTSHMLQIFTINKKMDVNGKEVKVSGEFHTTMENIPVPFDCVLEPRFGGSLNLLN